MRTRQINFRVTANPASEKKMTEYSPVTGTITDALIQFPLGCNFLVEAFIYHKSKKILPETRTGIILDDTTQRFLISEPVVIGDPIEVRIINHDAANSHTINFVVSILEAEKKIEIV